MHSGHPLQAPRLLERPLIQTEQARAVTDDIPKDSVQRGAVLLVEDEPFVALVARQVLEDHGFAVTVATHGQTALAHAREAASGPQGGAFVLAVVDLGLPDMGGDEVVRALRALAPDQPILVASGYDTEELQAEFSAVAQVAFMSKPYDGATFRSALRSLGFDLPE